MALWRMRWLVNGIAYFIGTFLQKWISLLADQYGVLLKML